MKWYSPSMTPDSAPASAASGALMNARAFAMSVTSKAKKTRH